MIIEKSSLFNVLYHISFNFQHTQSYYTPKFCKCYKDSAGLDRFALAALERELWPRRPVHFFMPHSLPGTATSTASAATSPARTALELSAPEPGRAEI